MTDTLLAAPDKMRGTASARQIADAIAQVARRFEWICDPAPMADGGEGTLEVFSGRRRTTTVTGPLGDPVEAQWILQGELAIVEMAQASGLQLVGGRAGNDPLAATTAGTGELIAAAMKAGASEIVVGLGGSATTDGGLGAVKALWPQTRVREIDLVVAVDVDTLFVDAARVFAPQKGASAAQVELLEGRLRRLVTEYQQQFEFDVSQVPGGGAAGGLAGGLAAVGATIVSGFEYVAELIELEERIERATAVVTTEGHLDRQSFNGKVVGGVLKMAAKYDVPTLIVVGDCDDNVGEDLLPANARIVSLVRTYGESRAFEETLECVDDAVAEFLAQW